MDKTDTYKYLGILQSRQIEQLTTELTTRLQKTFRTYSNSKSLTKAINRYVIPSLIHFSGIILCSQTNLESLEGIIRTKMPKPACTIKALVVKGFNYQKMRVVQELPICTTFTSTKLNHQEITFTARHITPTYLKLHVTQTLITCLLTYMILSYNTMKTSE